MTWSYLIFAVITGIIVGACALLAQRTVPYLLASLHDDNVTISSATATQVPTAPASEAPATSSKGSSAGSTSTETTPESTKSSSAPAKQSKPSASSSKPAKKKSTTVKSSSASSEIAPESSCPDQDNPAKTDTVLVCMSSYARKYHGIKTVSGNNSLMNSAAAKAQDIKNCDEFSHTACGRAFNYWFAVKGYTGNCQAENIAQGQETPGEVFSAWMKSPSHRDNILNPDYDDMGVASLSASDGIIWVMHLGGC